MDCGNIWEYKKYMGSGGLSQVAVSETADAGVLVKVDGEKAKRKILTLGKKEGEAQTPVGR